MKLKRALMPVLVVGVMTVGIAGIAYADQVGGGTWNHGFSNGQVFSNYYHGSRCHSSTVWNGKYHGSGPTRAGNWARASAPDSWRIDKAYWNYSNGC